MSTPGLPNPNFPHTQPNVWQAPAVPTPGYNPSGIPANRLYGGGAPAPTPAPAPAQPDLWRPAPAPGNPGNANQNPFAVPPGAVAHIPHAANHADGHHNGGHETHRLRHTVMNIGFIALSTAVAMKLGDHHNPKHYAEVVGATFAGSLVPVIGGFSFRQWRQGRRERSINNNQTDADHPAAQAANLQGQLVRSNNVIGLPVGHYDPTSFKYVDETTYAEPPSPFANPILTQKPGFNPTQFAESLRKNGPLRVKRRNRTH